MRRSSICHVLVDIIGISDESTMNPFSIPDVSRSRILIRISSNTTDSVRLAPCSHTIHAGRGDDFSLPAE